MPGRAQIGVAAGSACLYAGPVLAGWVGLGIVAIVSLVVVFISWLLALRTEFRPGGGEGWGTRLAMASAVQLVLVTAVYGAGALLGHAVALPDPLAPLAGLPGVLLISVTGIAIARAAYTPISPAAEAEIDRMIDDLEREVARFQDTVTPDDDGPAGKSPETKS